MTQDLARELTGISRAIRRQVGVLVDRRGAVTHVMVGDAGGITMPDWGRMRAGPGRLRGLRCVKTHLGHEGLSRDDVTDLVGLRLDAMATIEAREDGLPGDVHTAALLPANDDGEAIQYLDPVPPSRLDLDFQDFVRALEEELARTRRTRAVGASE
ncbi:MAG: GTPase HflX, partial [Myxococcota bacterium]|nr:GTPase HflX [Myxococcota bacterium]